LVGGTAVATTGGRVGSDAKVGKGVGEGRIGVTVAVGSAAWVMVIATQAWVKAAFWMSATLKVGVAAGPQAAKVRIIRIDIGSRNFLVI